MVVPMVAMVVPMFVAVVRDTVPMFVAVVRDARTDIVPMVVFTIRGNETSGVPVMPTKRRRWPKESYRGSDGANSAHRLGATCKESARSTPA